MRQLFPVIRSNLEIIENIYMVIKMCKLLYTEYFQSALQESILYSMSVGNKFNVHVKFSIF